MRWGGDGETGLKVRLREPMYMAQNVPLSRALKNAYHV